MQNVERRMSALFNGLKVRCITLMLAGPKLGFPSRSSEEQRLALNIANLA
jgi:hypothetical protein